MKPEYVYYTNENNVFRGLKGYLSVNEVLRVTGWEPWKGDPVLPVMEGEQLSKDDADAAYNDLVD